MHLLPTTDTVDLIAGESEPVLRNLRITQCYFGLSSAMAARTGPGANWCTFATWASKQAGQTIRKEDLKRALERLIQPQSAGERGLADLDPDRIGEDPAMVEKVWKLFDPERIQDRSSEAVSRGNRKVFAEIGREFARFLTECGGDAAYDEAWINAFCNGLRPGDPPDGQQYLRRAFRRYYTAFFEPDEKQKAELMLLANLEIGFHEQNRLQPEIAAGLDAAIPSASEITRSVLASLFPYRGWLLQLAFPVMRFLGRPLAIDRTLDRLIDRARKKVRLLLTKHLMVLGFPEGQDLRLGRDLHGAFPQPLQHLDNPDLLALLRRIDPTPDSLIDTGAIDWADLPDRMHYIGDLFRSQHFNARLLEMPFLQEQTAAIRAGQIPDGRL
ncbi:MAG TPA: hypothetical protein PKE06_14620 [Flavilitoribacter sp.]|nr:hypothetical protein [Flavilitoribacter sp.]HMQ89228.1 hypothetical protein [Flavilitoribacter sp.]